jgi:signal transduction histidine kinase
LEQLVREVTLRRHELEKALDEARSARDEVNRLLQLRDEFISVASHELKTPLTPMCLQTQMLTRMLKTNAPEPVKAEKMRAYLEMCGRQIEMLLNLIETLLDMSRIRLGQFILNRTPGLDLAELIRSVVARHHAQWEAACSPVTVHVAGPAPSGSWDRTRIEQVVTNLLSNAIKYGSGHPIEVTISQDEQTARLAVRDQGIGISADDQARIFNRFERAGSIKSFGGMGLGLYITRQIVSSHGGTIRVESAPGAGSTFIVELPLNPP